MNKLTLFLDTGSNRISLERPIHTFSDCRMMVKNASIFWDSVNVVTNVNDTVELSEIITFGEGYWTFSMIKAYLRRSGVVLVANEWNNTCSIDLLLGFPEDCIVPAGSWRTSPKQVEINKSLRYVTTGCNIVNETRNFDTNGRRSNIVCTLPITSQQSLNGTVTSFGDRQCSVPLYNGVFRELMFDVSDICS